MGLWQRLRARWQAPAVLRAAPAIPDALWHETLARWPFLAAATPDSARLRALADAFLAQKEFHGAHGLEVTDAMAVAIAAQACLPLLHLGPPAEALGWYDDFVGIVVHPGEAVARREFTDESGVVHHYDEVLAGEAMERGPVMLSWPDVEAAGGPEAEGYSVVIHEFVHKMDMRNGPADGCPPLPPGFLGTSGPRAARAAWLAVLEPAHEAFREQVIIAERFGGAEPWLDPYGAESLSEFLPVACEAYFVRPARFAQEFPTLPPLFDAFFRPARHPLSNR
ncbi:zinc-dependent peptidase [uncultured Xylophilus sp.]|uniref:M90 family metallopeptidase n=1 Tax=uncultured Xylophilus sp. TaxID=296832 RepID=UPI0025FC8C24|nr:zinc-dependent peptidase [uncultured Xylophilus sp.]